MGFPKYVSMYRKLDNGEEIQNAACRHSRVMMRLRIINYAMNEADQKYDKDNLPHGTKVLKESFLPWDNTDMIVCADSYFA